MIILIMGFSVIAANFQKEKVLENYFSSFLGISSDVEWELVFIDDGSTDNSLQIAYKYSDRLPLKIIELDKNEGPAHARNRGLDQSQYDHIIFTDTDICFESKTLTEAYDIFIRKGLDVLTLNLDLEPLTNKWMGKVYLLEEYENLEAARVESGPYPYFSTTCSIVKKNWITENGSFDEKFKGADIEDLILAFGDNKDSKFWFSKELRFMHDYPDNSLVFKKAFSRSFMLAQIDNDSFKENPLLDNKFRIYGYLLTLVWTFLLLAVLYNPQLISILLMMTVIEICYHYRLYSMAATLYGPLFVISVFFGRLIFVLSAFLGHVLGKVYPKKAV